MISGVGRTRSAAFRVAVFSIYLLGLAVALEGAARIAWSFRYALVDRLGLAAVNLDSYEVLDQANPRLIRLRPGIHSTLVEAIRSKEERGRKLGARFLTESAERLGVAEDTVIFGINEDGFKGPPLDRTRSSLRILTLGDSTTFGTLIDRYSYPRVLERELRKRGVAAEVVNGGVEGYRPRDLMLRIEEFKALRPELTVVYIGWNALYREDPFDAEGRVYTWRLLRGSLAKIHGLVSPQEAAWSAYNREKLPLLDSPELARLQSYQPSFLGSVEEVLLEMKVASRQVILTTLPGLFTMAEAPSERALTIGHLPTFTDNPYVLARMAERYNAALRALAKKHHLVLIDLDQWAGEALLPRDHYFLDSVHLTEEGQEAIGRHLALRIYPLLEHGSGSGRLDGSGPGEKLLSDSPLPSGGSPTPVDPG